VNVQHGSSCPPTGVFGVALWHSTDNDAGQPRSTGGSRHLISLLVGRGLESRPAAPPGVADHRQCAEPPGRAGRASPSRSRRADRARGGGAGPVSVLLRGWRSPALFCAWSVVRSPSKASDGRRALTAEAVVVAGGGAVVADDSLQVGEERAEVVDAAADA